MDPLSALSLAGTIVQLVDFGGKLLSDTVQLYKSSCGKLDANQQLQLITGDLQSVIAKLQATPDTASGNAFGRPIEAIPQQEDSLRKICDEASIIAEELLRKLQSLTVKDGKHRVLESLKIAIRSAWSKEEISSLKQRLALFKESLHSRLMLSIRYAILCGIAYPGNYWH
jgi:hypothetical protein